MDLLKNLLKTISNGLRVRIAKKGNTSLIRTICTVLIIRDTVKEIMPGRHRIRYGINTVFTFNCNKSSIKFCVFIAQKIENWFMLLKKAFNFELSRIL